MICCLKINGWRVVKCIYHERGARVISFTDDWQTTSDILGKASLVSKSLFRFYFDSNTQETTKRQMRPSDCPIFRHYMNRNPAKNFDCNRGIYLCFVSFWREKTTLHRLISWKWKLTSPNEWKWRHASPCSELSRNKSMTGVRIHYKQLCWSMFRCIIWNTASLSYVWWAILKQFQCKFLFQFYHCNRFHMQNKRNTY